MKSTAWIIVSIAAGLIPGPTSAHDVTHSREPQPEVTVYLARRCAMQNSVWTAAERTAVYLFRRIGVQLRFTATMPVEPDDRMINLLVLDRAPKNLGPHVLGAATNDATFGPVVFVFYDRLLEFHDYVYNEDTGVVMGYAIAHEIGHVLRSEPGHSAAGIMKAYWGEKDAFAMIRGAVAFTPYDSARIHQVLTEQPRAKIGLIRAN